MSENLKPTETLLRELFDLTPCHRDPAVGEFGLENVLLPIGTQFLEIVAPIEDGTAAGRYLARRGGEGGYMVITQCDDAAPRARRFAEIGVRIAHQFKIDDFVNMQLHPRDTGGSFFEIDQQLGPRANQLDGPWAPAGYTWSNDRPSSVVTAIAAAEIQCADPLATATRWGQIAELPVEREADTFLIELDNALLRFVSCDDGRPEGLAGLDLLTPDRNAMIEKLPKHGAAEGQGFFLIAGMRWRFVA
ncbi:MAG: VOC family protein [Pseudomonadota bacterium]